MPSEIVSEKGVEANIQTPFSRNKTPITKTSRQQSEESPFPLTAQTYAVNNKNQTHKMTDEEVMDSVNKITSQHAPPIINNNVYMDADFWYHKGVVLNGDKLRKRAPV